MAMKKQEMAIQLYADLMAELKMRVNSIPTASNIPNGLPPELVREFCFLQLRMTCELIALSCLVAHGDIKATQSKKMKKAYSAEFIFQRLDELHPDFYPHPGELVTEKPNTHSFKNLEGDFLQKSDLLRLYAKCGDVLHRGSMKKILSEEKRPTVSFSDVNNWVKKFPPC
jgi:hypothetical protein